MIIKTDKFELEISSGTEVYFGSKTSGQIFKKWDEFKEEEKRQLEIIKNVAERLLKESEAILLPGSLMNIDENL
jgi:hypothetical protein